MIEKLKVGDRVTFKRGGTEDYGVITYIDGYTATIKVWDSVAGEHYKAFEALSRLSKD